MLQIKKGKATHRYERITAAIGAVLVIVVGFNTVRAESAQTREQLGNTIDYVKEQCTTYTRYNAAAVTKSLMRIMDNAQQVNRNIGYEGSAVDEERLRFYAQEQRLTGIILLDTDGSVQCEYNGDLLNFLTLQEYIERDTVLDVVRYPQKTYASRIDLPDGSYVDISAYGSTDVPCDRCILSHHCRYARNYALTIQNIAGYNTRDDGVIVVANGTTALSRPTMKSWLIPRWRTAVFCSRSSQIFRPPRSGISSAMAAPISAAWIAAATTISTPMYPTAW